MEPVPDAGALLVALDSLTSEAQAAADRCVRGQGSGHRMRHLCAGLVRSLSAVVVLLRALDVSGACGIGCARVVCGEQCASCVAAQ